MLITGLRDFKGLRFCRSAAVVTMRSTENPSVLYLVCVLLGRCDVQMVKMMITVVIIYALCWLPLHTITLVGDSHPGIWK